jgi:hypothetical protein
MDLLLYVLLARPLLFVNDPVIYWEEKRMDKRGGRFLPGRNGHAGLTLMIKKEEEENKTAAAAAAADGQFCFVAFFFLARGIRSVCIPRLVFFLTYNNSINGIPIRLEFVFLFYFFF